MYRSFSQLREGWAKNLVLLLPSPLRLATLRLMEFLLIVGSATIAFVAISRGNYRPGSFAAILAVIMIARLLRRIRKAHFSWTSNALAPFGLPIFSYLLLRSRLSYKKGLVTWKGRTYVSPPGHNATSAVAGGGPARGRGLAPGGELFFLTLKPKFFPPPFFNTRKLPRKKNRHYFAKATIPTDIVNN